MVLRGYWVLVTIRPEPIRISPVTDLPIFTFPHSPSLYLSSIRRIFFVFRVSLDKPNLSLSFVTEPHPTSFVHFTNEMQRPK